ncbi:helix-turn-helix transcriptional regulator, partial [Saccharothrix sp. NRRL B-16348]|uniref:helix-turn-helix transcriptional regulator n=1 Tax=Saccharothrix sp. NRRL B-16348 TaxID=1415542 RepID=UPI0012FC8C46
MPDLRWTDSDTAAAIRLALEIKRRREEAGLSQPQLARRIGYTRQYVSLAERPGHNLPSLG